MPPTLARRDTRIIHWCNTKHEAATPGLPGHVHNAVPHTHDDIPGCAPPDSPPGTPRLQTPAPSRPCCCLSHTGVAAMSTEHVALLAVVPEPVTACRCGWPSVRTAQHWTAVARLASPPLRDRHTHGCLAHGAGTLSCAGPVMVAAKCLVSTLRCRCRRPGPSAAVLGRG